jgi:CMP/dCMP kinase
MASEYLQIAIDGPVGSGKSSIASQLAKRLNITYLYTGAMYRAFALWCRQHAVRIKETKEVLPLLQTFSIQMRPALPNSSRSCQVILNGEDVTELLFTPEIDLLTSDVSTLKEVRQHMVLLQQQLAEKTAVVMEGRDIGLRVLPHAPVKIYLTASVEERARRRKRQYEKQGISKTLPEVIEETKIRDHQDSTRETDPLQVLPDAWEFDTTGKTEEAVIQEILAYIKKKWSVHE